MSPRASYMTPSDAAWLHMEKPTNLMMITGLMWFDEPVDPDAIEQLLDERLVQPYPRFTCRVHEPRLGVGPPRWEEDPDFDLSWHVQRIRLPAPGSRKQLQELVSDLMSTPLDFDRPLWQFHLVEGFEGDRLAFVSRMHHCIGDGISLARVLLSLADNGGDTSKVIAAPDLKRPRAFYRPALEAMKATLKGGEALFREGRDLLANPAKVAELGKLGGDLAQAATRLLTLPPDPPTILRGDLGTRKHCVWSPPLPLSEVKATSKALDCTINDVLLAAMSGALRSYLQGRGSLVEDLRAFVPVNMRPLDQPVPRELGNKFTLALLRLPVGKATPRERLDALKQEMDAIKASQQPAVAYAMLNAIGMTPPRVEDLFLRFFGTKGSAVMTNVPGPQVPLTFAGYRAGGFLFWVPMSAGASLGVSIFSYAGGVNVGVAADAGLVPDPEALVAAYLEEFEALKGLVPA